MARTLNPLLLLAALLLAACAGTGTGRPADQAERRAEILAENGRHADSAALYIGLASDRTGAERDRLTLLAVEQWLDAGDGRRARAGLGSVPTPSGGELLWLWSADAAALALWEGRPDSALELLEPLGRQSLPRRYRLRVEALRADAWFQKQDPAKAVGLYMQRESWIDDMQGIEQNRQRLWAGLLVSDAQVLRDAADYNLDPELRGWLTLGALATSTGQQGIGWSNGVVRWREAYPGHPAEDILAGLTIPDRGLLQYPAQVALLLPLSGNNAAAGKAIQNGFFGAYFAAAAELQTEQRIRIYDVADSGGASAAYARAVREGAEFVVGPLIRRNVAELAGESLMPVPVLALNYAPDNVAAPPGFYQFALAPEDEAAAAAQRAIADGSERAVALYPDNAWGRRVASSFSNEFESNGGILLDHRSYEPTSQDFSVEIEGLMALSQSVQRYRRLRANIGGQALQFDPRRRQDVDMVFLAADAKAGRLIKSQLKFHYSGDLPVYSTSFIYSMDGRSDTDLEGVMFADTPWIVSPPAWIADYPQIYDEFWPSEKRLARLHAMGYDAYHLVAGLYAARSGPMEEISGATGRLYLAADGRIHRRLAWAQFDGGRPVALRDTGELDAMNEDFGPADTSDELPGWQDPLPEQ